MELLSTDLMISKIKDIPAEMKIGIVTVIVLYIAYTIYKNYKNRPMTPYEYHHGSEWRSNKRGFMKTIRLVKNTEIKDMLREIYNISHKIYKRVIALDTKTVQNKLSQDLNSEIIVFESQTLPLLTRLIQNYIDIEKRVTYTEYGDKVFEGDNINDAYGMQGIENELHILKKSFIELYNKIENSVAGNKAKLLDNPYVTDNHTQNGVDESNNGANLQEIVKIIQALNNSRQGG